MHTTTNGAYDARILKLRLPEQDSLKNDAERCSADPASLANIGRAVGQQVVDPHRARALAHLRAADPTATGCAAHGG